MPFEKKEVFFQQNCQAFELNFEKKNTKKPTLKSFRFEQHVLRYKKQLTMHNLIWTSIFNIYICSSAIIPLCFYIVFGFCML